MDISWLYSIDSKCAQPAKSEMASATHTADDATFFFVKILEYLFWFNLALPRLNSFSYTELTLNQQLTYDILENYFQLQLDMADMYLYDELLRPSTGVQAQLPILYEEYSFNSKKDVEDYLKLLALTDEYFDQIISFEKEKADAGLFMSDFACQNIIDQCNAFIADSDNHYLIETFNTRIDKLTGLTQSEKDHYRLQNEKILHEHIFPAYENLHCCADRPFRFRNQ